MPRGCRGQSPFPLLLLEWELFCPVLSGGPSLTSGCPSHVFVYQHLAEHPRPTVWTPRLLSSFSFLLSAPLSFELLRPGHWIWSSVSSTRGLSRPAWVSPARTPAWTSPRVDAGPFGLMSLSVHLPGIPGFRYMMSFVLDAVVSQMRLVRPVVVSVRGESQS